MKAVPLSILLLSLHFSVIAADKAPKEMRPKLLREGQVLVTDDFSAAEIDKSWRIPQGEFAGKVTLQDGAALIETGVGRQGYIFRKFEAGTTDAGIQLLMKPVSSTWMGVRFMTEGEDGAKNWKVATIVYASGIIRVVEPDATADAAKLKVLKSAKTDIKPGEWWRVSIESRDDKLLVRVNGKDLAELKHPGTAGEKTGVLVNLYGGTGLIDEVKVMAGGK
ncbi:MAG: hypothetical protein IPK22_05090 [Verrucomicrobiaceae bacterium]|nr:hypothetical protein [Verrucomicrobiaceae bacterium]